MQSFKVKNFDDGEISIEITGFRDDVKGTVYLSETQAKELSDKLSSVIYNRRKKRGECVCVGLSHHSDCPHKLPLGEMF